MKTDGLTKTIDGYLKALNQCRHRSLLLRIALQDIALDHTKDPKTVATDALDVDDRMGEADPTKRGKG